MASQDAVTANGATPSKLSPRRLDLPPEFFAMAASQAQLAHATPEQGVGKCGKRQDGGGHVWATKRNKDGDPFTACKFGCKTLGQKFGTAASRERTELFSRMRCPDSIKKPKARGG